VPFPDADYNALRQALDGVCGRFILSINDTPAVRRIFKGFRSRKLSTLYSASNARTAVPSRSKPRRELLIHYLR